MTRAAGQVELVEIQIVERERVTLRLKMRI
jgi:hypothetical protein